MVTEDKKYSGVLQQLVESGKATPPAEPGSPNLELDLTPTVTSLSDLLIEDRARERRS